MATEQMFQILQNATGLSSGSLAGLLGLPPELVAEWIAGSRPIPHSFVAQLTSLIGRSPDELEAAKRSTRGSGDELPAIWFKMRAPQLEPADKEIVLLIRHLGFLMHELEEVTGAPSVGWKTLFETIRSETDMQAPPREQGRQAARIFRNNRSLSQQRTGIGELFRGNLRSVGLLIVESPIAGSLLDGCSFYVGVQGQERPCVYANLHGSTWFHRNVVLMHEVGHAIFDAHQGGASLDFTNSTSHELEEERAQAFAQEALVPSSVLRHVAQHYGITWSTLTARELAMLVAETQVESKVVLAAARDAGFIDQEQHEAYAGLKVSTEVKALSERALSTKEWAKWADKRLVKHISGKRTTTLSSRPMRLPVPHIKHVVEAWQDELISRSRAAELLMIDESDFEERFADGLAATSA